MIPQLISAPCLPTTVDFLSAKLESADFIGAGCALDSDPNPMPLNTLPAMPRLELLFCARSACLVPCQTHRLPTFGRWGQFGDRLGIKVATGELDRDTWKEPGPGYLGG